MDLFGFPIAITADELSSILTAIAWPAVVAFMFWLLRDQIRSLLRGPVTRLRIGPFEAEWSRTVEEVKREVKVVSTASGPRGVVDDLWQLAHSDPAAAVLAGHNRLELTLQRRLNVFRDETNTPLPALVKKARRRNFISASTARAIDGMADLRNLAAHDHEAKVTDADAVEYLKLVEAIYGEVATWIRPVNPDAPNDDAGRGDK